MALADIASRLYQSSAYRNTSVAKALADSVKISLKTRFSLVGMAASLTGSRTLYAIAQQKYGISKEELQQEEKNEQFKKYTVESIATLSKQIALLESITEKNSNMINYIINDLGYFKYQKRMNPMTRGGFMAVQMPVNAKTVKGKLQEINEQIQALKGVRVAKATAEQNKINKQKEKDEKEKNRALLAAGILGTLTSLGVGAAGGGVAVAGLAGTAVAGATAMLGSAVINKTVKALIGKAMPILGTAFKVTALGGLALSSNERAMKRLRGERGMELFSKEDLKNEYNPGTFEYELKQQQIQMKKDINDLIESVMRPVDNAIMSITGFLALKYGINAAEFLKGKFGNVPRGSGVLGGIKGLMGMGAAATAAGGAAAAASAGGGVAAGVAGAAGAVAGRGLLPGMVRGGRVWDGKTWKSLPEQTGAPTTTAQRVRKKVPVIVKRGLAMMSGFINSPKLKFAAAKGGALGIAILVPTIMDMYAAVEQYENGNIGYDEYKNRSVEGWRTLVNVLGVGTISGVLGGLLGTAVGGPIGTAVGFLGGLGLGVVADFAMGDTTTSAAEWIFRMLYNGEPPPPLPTTTTGEQTTTPSEADLNAFNKVQKFEGVNQIDGGVETILATIRQKESGNNYNADLMKNPAAQERARKAGYAKASASGAYQFVDGTWQGLTKKYNIGTQYQRAVDAPPAVQDMVAAAYVNEVLIATNGDVSKVPVAWYTGNIQGELSAQQLAMNTGLTVERYQASWLDAYQKQGGASGTLMASRDRLNALRNNLAPQNSAEADQAMMKYFMSLGTIAQVLPTATETPAVADQTGDATSAEIKAEAAVVGVKRTVEELTRVAENVKVLQQKNNMNEPFPHVRNA